jgi:DNA-binding NarL/FixJ family response regulator
MGAVPPAAPAIRLLLADDHRLVVEALRALLASDPRLEIVGAAYDGQQAVELAVELEPDVVLMDIAMPVLDGIEATRQITDANPDIRVLILTGSEWNVDSARAREAGASGFILKERSVSDLVDAIVEVSTLLMAFGGRPANAPI